MPDTEQEMITVMRSNSKMERGYSSICDGIPGFICTLTATGDIEYANSQLLRYLGKTFDDIKLWRTNDIVHPDDLGCTTTSFRSSLETGEPWDLDHRLRGADGVYRWFHSSALPVRDAEGRIVHWSVLLIDIDDRKTAEGKLRRSEADLLDAQRISHTGSWRHEFSSGLVTVSAEMRRIWGISPDDDLSNPEFFWMRYHPEDRRRVQELYEQSCRQKTEFKAEHRIILPNGTVKHLHSTGHPVLTESGDLLEFVGTATDITERKLAEINWRIEVAERERAEESLKLQVDVLQQMPAASWTVLPDGTPDFASEQWQEYTGQTLEHVRSSPGSWMSALHPDDHKRVAETYWHGVRSGEGFTFEARFRRASDGAYRWHLSRAVPLRNPQGDLIRLVGTSTDIEDLKRAEQSRRESEQNFHLMVDGIAGLVATMNSEGEVELVNHQVLEYFGKTLSELKGWSTSDAVHPEDLPRVHIAWIHAVTTGAPYDLDHRLRRADGVYRWFQARGLPLCDSEGRLVRWYVLLTDIDERKRLEEKLRHSEESLLEAQRLSGTGTFRHDVPTGAVNVSPEIYRIWGIKPHEDAPNAEFFFKRMHPDDGKRVQELYEQCCKQKIPYEADYRLLHPDGTVKHLHSLGHPVLNDLGDLVEFVGTTMDVTEYVLARAELEKAFEEIKILKDQLHDENVALREQIAQGFMFEEIIGSSAVLQTVLSSVVQVAPTDSTVLISGETGTGKELIARAIHKRSRRANQAFISLNCASIPASLIASELFGHEKGAFTGALQQCPGRFELANGGTIFLDEISELPLETQVALLRVLQEREFERLGGTRPLRADVRVIAATNRDLSAAIAAGTFREDLFYRLNVFPIEVPPLRKRTEDIPMLVEYFVKRFAEKMGKQIRKIDKDTLELCKSYHWPGNVRELQNIVERCVILTAGNLFRINKAWLSSADTHKPTLSGPLQKALQNHERKLIEAALAESKGKVAGRHGAAAKLGVPPSTLDSKIKQLHIMKGKFSSS